MNPPVTIALAVFNGADTVRLAIESILQQSYSNFEFIIIDDGSMDDTLQVVKSFDDPRIRLVEGKNNMGLSSRLNQAVDMANGHYFSRMDSDDISYPERIEKQLDYLQRHPDIDLLGANIALFDDLFRLKGKLNTAESHADICAKPWNGFYLPHPTWMGKTDWFRAHPYYSFADGAEDQNLLLRSFHNSCFACMKDILLAYRETERPLKKTLRARAIFARSALASDVQSSIKFLSIKIVLMQILKGIADFLTVLLIPGLKRKLLPVDDKEKKEFVALKKKLSL